MKNPELHRTLEQLHSDLSGTESVDPESARLLIVLLADIAKVLARTEAEPEPAEDGILDRLSDLSREFGDQHPGLVSAIGRLADVLSRSGV